MNLRQLVLTGLAALALGGTAAAQSVQPSPPPAPNSATATATPAPIRPTAVPAGPTVKATATPSPAPQRGRRGNDPSPAPSPSDTPAPPQFQTLDGVWEFVLQPVTGPSAGKPFYSHLYVAQKGDALSGTWRRDDQHNRRYDFTGTFDGRLYTLTFKDGAATVYTMTGYVENFGDMVGLLKSADPKDLGTPFTASHRKKEKLG